MKKIKYLVPIIIIGLVLFLIRYNYDRSLKVNEIMINNSIIQLTNRKDDYLLYNEVEDFYVLNNKASFEIQIQNPEIITYKNIKAGDSVDKLDFCNKKIGLLYYYETDYTYDGYYMEIAYGINGFDNTILSITYRFFSK